MQFPEYERVIYKNCALEEVICQLRFPPVLRISAESPVEFQDAIRKLFPLFAERSPQSVIDLPSSAPSAVSDVFRGLMGKEASNRVFDFVSADGNWKVTLTNNFLALSTTAYTRWEDFSARLELPLSELLRIYEPSFFLRVGIRYRDVILRSKLGLSGVPWSELLESYIAAELVAEPVAESVITAIRELVLRLDDDEGLLRIQHFMADHVETKEQCYVIDADFFSEMRTEPEHGLQKLTNLNRYAGRFFRWCISDRLYEAMAPQSVAQP